MFDGVSNFANSVDGTFLFTLIVSIFFLLLITITMLYFVYKYNRKRNPKAVNVHSNTALEVTWTVIPTILVLIMFWFGWVSYLEESDIPDNAMPVDVTAQMWKWSFKYENGKLSDSLYVPVNTPIKLNLHSSDVNHAFFVPAFRLKKDVYPGLKRETWFQADKVGRYHIACAEYCGLNHSYMANTVIVMPKEKFNEWIADTTSVTDTTLLNQQNNN